MSRLDVVWQLWTDPRIGILTAVIVGAVVGCAVQEWRDHR